MPAFDVDSALRWGRLDPGKTLARRTDEHLPFLSDTAEAGHELLLDTCVYIDGMQGRSPDVVADLLDVRQVNHSTIAFQELMHTIGVLDPGHPRTKAAIGQIKTTIAAMPEHRIFTPDADVLGRGAMLSGILCRIQGYQQDARLRALHDCVLFLQAQKLGLTVLTANVSDFDYLLQLMPTSRVLLYRVAA